MNSSKPIFALRVDEIDALLPQTQCRQCGFDGCRPYAEALAQGTARINRCPPGGLLGMQRLADYLKLEPEPIDPACGKPGPLRLARIDELHCIGCTLCIQSCPVDAIIGAPQRMHAVLEPECTGCGLCVPVCPVDCIEMQNHPQHQSWTTANANAARQRYEARKRRLAQESQKIAAPLLPSLAQQPESNAEENALGDVKQTLIQAALARARARRADR